MANDLVDKMGRKEAHTPGALENSAGKPGSDVDQVLQPVDVDPARAAKIGSDRATVEAAMADLVNRFAPAAEPAGQLDLVLDDHDALFAGPVKHVAETLAGSRGRGRPKGSQNKHTFRDTLLRMGFQHPGVALAQLANADPEKLARELSCTRLDAMELIRKANAELLPYFEAKRPTEIQVNETTFGVMIVGTMDTRKPTDTGILDLENVPQPD